MTFKHLTLALTFSVLGSTFGTLTYAHPVSFKNGLGIMSYNSPEMNEFLLTYSFTPRFALAATYLRDSESEFYVPRANFLLKRWNEDDSQANVYFSLGSGIEKFGEQNKSAHLADLVVDWETRKYYVYLSHLYLRRDNQTNALLPSQDYNNTKFRLGFAPFLADYTDLNVWMITQIERKNDEKQIEATQFMRFYIRNVLWEVGAGFDGSIKFNYMIHL